MAKILTTLIKYYFITLILFFSGTLLYSLTPAPNLAQLPPELMMSEEEFNQMLEFLSTLDEKELQELEKIGRQVLTDMGINPDTLEPIPGAQQPELPITPTPQPEQKQPVIQEPVVTQQDLNTVKQLVHDLLQQIYRVQEQIVNEYRQATTTPLAQDLDNLIFYLKILDNNTPLLTKLTQPQYKKMISIMQQLYNQLKEITIPSVSIPEDQIDDPYDILGISESATLKEITAAYESKMRLIDSDTIKKQMSEEGASEKDIKRALKEAQLTRDLFLEAFETLQDPISRERFDQERSTKIAHSIERQGLIRAAYEKIAQAVQSAIYTQGLTTLLDKFLTEYEPEKLKMKKAREEAEIARRKEQEALAKTRPTITPGQLERPVRRIDSRSPGAGAPFPFQAGGRAGSLPFGSQPSDREARPQPVTQPKEAKPDAPKTGTIPIKKPEKAEKPAEKDKPKTAKEDGKKGAPKKAPSITAPELLNKLEKETKKLQETTNKSKSNLENLAAITHRLPDVPLTDLSVKNALNDLIKEVNFKDLTSNFKDLAKMLKEKKLTVMRPEDITMWKQYHASYAPLFDFLSKQIDAGLADDFHGRPLNKDILFDLVGSEENKGPLALLKNYLRKINKYLKQINDIVSPTQKTA